jgi:uncharacterized protein
MERTIFVNLPVADVAASTRFYEALGFVRNPDFSNDQASGMVWSDSIWVMLLSHEFYSTFTPKAIADTHTSSAALLCLSCASRDEVDRLGAAAVAAGGRELHGADDRGFMYGRAFDDLDGHGWEVMHMDANAKPAEQHDAAVPA